MVYHCGTIPPFDQWMDLRESCKPTRRHFPQQRIDPEALTSIPGRFLADTGRLRPKILGVLHDLDQGVQRQGDINNNKNDIQV